MSRSSSPSRSAHCCGRCAWAPPRAELASQSSHPRRKSVAHRRWRSGIPPAMVVAPHLPAGWRSQSVLGNAARWGVLHHVVTVWVHSKGRSQNRCHARFAGSLGRSAWRSGCRHLLPRQHKVCCGRSRHCALLAESLVYAIGCRVRLDPLAQAVRQTSHISVLTHS